MYKSATLTPAYGRDYKSKTAVLTDWNANLDFRLQPQGVMVNKAQMADLKNDGYTHLHFRYRRNEQIVVVAIK